jgi:hypothetical protein
MQLGAEHVQLGVFSHHFAILCVSPAGVHAESRAGAASVNVRQMSDFFMI